MNTLEQITIGSPDQFRVKKIVEAYEILALHTGSIKYYLDQIFGETKKESLVLLLEFVKSNEPQKMLIKRYIEIKKIDIPELDTDALISFDLIKMPKETITELLQAKVDFDKSLKVLEKLNYSNLSISELSRFDMDGTDIFDIPEDFEIKVQNDLAIRTESDQEKFIVEKLQNLCDAINDLVEAGALPQDKRCLKTSFFLTPTLTVDRSKSRPAMLSQQIFRAARLRKFATGSLFRAPAGRFDKEKFLS